MVHYTIKVRKSILGAQHNYKNREKFSWNDTYYFVKMVHKQISEEIYATTYALYL